MKAQEKLKLSHYNFIIPKEDGTYLVYNTVNGVIIQLSDEKEIEELKKYEQSEVILYDEDNAFQKAFIEQEILVPLDKDEFEYVRYLYERDVVRDSTLQLTLITTRQCNLRCVYCYEEHEDKHMSQTVYENLLKFIEKMLKERVFSNVSIGLFGGEPFVPYRAVIQFLRQSKAICDKYQCGFYASATTNGALITPERFEELAKVNCLFYQITIDGLADTQDKYRICRDGSGSFETIMSNLKYMVTTDYLFHVIIRTNFNEEVVKRAEEFYQYIKDNFDDRFTIYYEEIKKLGGNNDEQLQVLEQEETVEESVRIANILNRFGLKNDVIDAMTMPFSRICYATKHQNYLIDYDGIVLKCTLALDDDKNKVGKITDEGELELNEEKHACWVGKKSGLMESCKVCRVLPLCYGGHCVNGRIHGQTFVCDFKQEELELEKLMYYYQ